MTSFRLLSVLILIAGSLTAERAQAEVLNATFNTQSECILFLQQNLQGGYLPYQRSKESILNPCGSGTPKAFVYAWEKYERYSCVKIYFPAINPNAGKYGIVLYSQVAMKYNVFSSFGPTSFGNWGCTSTPYKQSTEEVFSYAQANGLIKTITTATPIRTPNTPEYISRYGIPDYWTSTTLSTTSTYPGNVTHTFTETTAGQSETVPWNYGYL